MLLAQDAPDCDIGSVGAVGSVTPVSSFPTSVPRVPAGLELGGARLFFDVHVVMTYSLLGTDLY